MEEQHQQQQQQQWWQQQQQMQQQHKEAVEEDKEALICLVRKREGGQENMTKMGTWVWHIKKVQQHHHHQGLVCLQLQLLLSFLPKGVVAGQLALPTAISFLLLLVSVCFSPADLNNSTLSVLLANKIQSFFFPPNNVTFTSLNYQTKDKSLLVVTKMNHGISDSGTFCLGCLKVWAVFGFENFSFFGLMGLGSRFNLNSKWGLKN